MEDVGERHAIHAYPPKGKDFHVDQRAFATRLSANYARRMMRKGQSTLVKPAEVAMRGFWSI